MACSQPQQAAQPTPNQPSTLFPAFNLNIYKSPNPNPKKWNSADGPNSLPSAQRPQCQAVQDGLPILFSGCSWNIYLILQFCQTTFPLMAFPFSSQLDLQAPNTTATRPSQLNTHSCALQIDSISQFLELRPSTFKQQSPLPHKQLQTDSKSDQQHAESLPTLEHPPLPARPPKKPSLFHNFQKHLITTIRACVRLKPVLHHRRSTAGLAHQLWEYFVGQKRPSKRFLLSFLGRGKGDNKSSPEESGFRKEFQHLVGYFSEYSAGEVQEAQEYLCREITRQGRKIILQEQASISRINRPREFRLYFAKFIEELEQGEVRRRLPKLVKIELTNTNAEESE